MSDIFAFWKVTDDKTFDEVASGYTFVAADPGLKIRVEFPPLSPGEYTVEISYPFLDLPVSTHKLTVNNDSPAP